MAHSYTPGLKVLKKTIFKKERILPLKGDVLVKEGDNLNPDTIVASTNLPGNVQMLKVSNILNIDNRFHIYYNLMLKVYWYSPRS